MFSIAEALSPREDERRTLRPQTELISLRALPCPFPATFLPNDTALDDFVHDGSPARGEALLAWEPRPYMGGFVKVAREHAGVELVGIESPPWPRTGTGSGWITSLEEANTPC